MTYSGIFEAIGFGMTLKGSNKDFLFLLFLLCNVVDIVVVAVIHQRESGRSGLE